MKTFLFLLSLLAVQAGEAGAQADGGKYRFNLRTDYLLVPSLGVEIGENYEIRVGPELRLTRRLLQVPGGFVYCSVGLGLASYVMAGLLEWGVYENEIYQVKPGIPIHTEPSGSDEAKEMDIYPPLVMTAGYERELSKRWNFRLGLTMLWWSVRFGREEDTHGRLYPFIDMGFTVKLGKR